MKKLFAAIAAVGTVFAASAAMAQDEAAVLPAFDVTLNGQKVDSQNREYPLFVYRDITYFPMTYFDCRFLGLTTDWDDRAYTLTINKENIAGMYRDYASETNNPDSWTVRPVEVPVGQESRYTGECVEPAHFVTYVNGKEVGGGEYPLMTLRGVTYFPLTWEYAHDMFGWDYGFDENGLSISSDNYHTEILNLPGFDGTNVAEYGGYYFYQAGQEIRRAPVDNLSAAETVYTMPLPPWHEGAEWGTAANPAMFSVRDGELRMTFTDVDTATFTDYHNMKYDSAQNTFVNDDRPDTVSNSTGPSVRYYYTDDIVVKIGYTASYSRGGEEVSLRELGNAYGCRVLGHRLYLRCAPADGYDSGALSDLYKVDMDTGEITLVTRGINGFWAFEGPEGDLIYTRTYGEGLTRLDTGELIYSEAGLAEGTHAELDMALLGDELALYSRADGLTRLQVFPEYGSGRPREILSSDAYGSCGSFDGGFYVYLGGELPEDKYRVAILREGREPYLSSDIPESWYGKIFAEGGDAIYVTEGKAVRVTLDREA